MDFRKKVQEATGVSPKCQQILAFGTTPTFATTEVQTWRWPQSPAHGKRLAKAAGQASQAPAATKPREQSKTAQSLTLRHTRERLQPGRESLRPGPKHSKEATPVKQSVVQKVKFVLQSTQKLLLLQSMGKPCSNARPDDCGLLSEMRAKIAPG